VARIDELRLMAKVARFYYEDGLSQAEITSRLDIHQSTVSRLLSRAQKAGIVRITLSAPSGLHSELEDALQTAYGLREAIVVDSMDQEDQIVRDLGAAAAFYLETTLKSRDVVGISSWSAALLATVEAMHPNPKAKGARVVQILGGIGHPGAELHATLLTRRLADLLSGTATLLPAPGAVGSVDAKRIMLKERYVLEALALFKSITIALVGIGAVEPSTMLASSGNVFSNRELETLSAAGAVGDICLRFFDGEGRPVVTPLNDRVIAIELEDLKRANRVVGIAGGRRKTAAIRGALQGRWINVLITDRATAERLVRTAPDNGRSRPVPAPAATTPSARRRGAR
jgi:DNA-binding transcriptional regulator LsrR (DeoR family)